MKSIGEISKNRERFEKEYLKDPNKKLIDEIYRRCNTDRVKEGYKPLPWIAYKKKVHHLSQTELHALVKRMSQSVNPGKIFFGSLKVRKETG